MWWSTRTWCQKYQAHAGPLWRAHHTNINFGGRSCRHCNATIPGTYSDHLFSEHIADYDHDSVVQWLEIKTYSSWQKILHPWTSYHVHIHESHVYSLPVTHMFIITLIIPPSLHLNSIFCSWRLVRYHLVYTMKIVKFWRLARNCPFSQILSHILKRAIMKLWLWLYLLCVKGCGFQSVHCLES